MTDARHLCPCGRPIHDGAHLCQSCTDRLRANLRTIAARWDDLEAMLTAAEKGGGDGGRGNHADSVGLSLNEAAMRARTAASNLAWFAMQVIRDDYDDLGRPFTPPNPPTVPALLTWVERWHLAHLLHDGAEETAHEIDRDAAQVERLTFNALEPVRWVDVNLTCDKHGTSDMGERVPCEGKMRAKVGRGVLPDLVCSDDPSHVVTPAQWERAQWHRTAKLDEAATRRLVRQIAT